MTINTAARFVGFFSLLIPSLVYGISWAEEAQESAPRSAFVSVPSGPFSKWPENLKSKTVASLSFRCDTVGVMALGNYHGPEVAAREYVRAVSAACVDGQMPDDWPGHSETRESLLRHFDLAHQQDPNLEMPQWPKEGSRPAHTPAEAEAQKWNDRPSSSTDLITFSLIGAPYHTPPKNTDASKPMALPEHKDEERQIQYRIPRNYIVLMDDWNGGAQTLVRLKVTFPGFEPLTQKTAQCLSLSPAFRPTSCTPVAFVLRRGGAYEPPDDVRFNNASSLFHSQLPLAGPYGFALYEIGPTGARSQTYRMDTPQHMLVINCFRSSKDEAQLSVCHTESRLESGNVLAYFLYSDQLKDAERIDTGIRELVRSFQLEAR
jgi:hypothetical protein